MKKKLTNGEKRECRLRYLFRQLKRAGNIKKDTPMKACRGELDELITLQEKKPRKVKKKKPQQRPVAKAFRRKARKQLRAKFTRAIQIAKKLRRERRKAYDEEKALKRKVPIVHTEDEVQPLQGKLSKRPKVNVDLS